MDIKKLFDLAGRFDEPAEIAELVLTSARDLAALMALIAANHARAKRALDAADREEIEAVYRETLALIDAFDAELAKAAAQ